MTEHRPEGRGGGFSRGTWVLIGFSGVAAYLLFSEHRAHAIEFLPFGLLAACLLMHRFHRHGGHGGGRHDRRPDAAPGRDEQTWR